MKMKKMIYCLFALMLFSSATSMNAQVAIGTENPNMDPHPGAILDLGQVKANNLGLLLPQVTLTDAKIWAPVVGAKADEVDGMMVYNDSPCAINGLTGKGAYVWYDKSWNKIGSEDPASKPDPNFTQPDPVAATVCYGGTATFTLAKANGCSDAVTYNWQKSANGSTGWTDAEGTHNEADYTTRSLYTDTYYRRQAISCTCGTIESKSAKVTVSKPATSVTSATSPYNTYATYSYPNHLGEWTENISEAGYAETTYTGHNPGERGYYYDWQNASDACKSIGTDWALPSFADWHKLFAYLGGFEANFWEKGFFSCGSGLAGYLYISTQSFAGWASMGAWWISDYSDWFAAYHPDDGFRDAIVSVSGYVCSVRCVRSN